MNLYILSLFVALTLTLAFAGDDKDMAMLKKWAFAKAIGQCVGEDNMKKWMIMKKEAHRKCTGMPTPELELPMFKTPYRMADGLVMNAFNKASSSSSNEDWMFQAMKRHFLKKVVQKMMNEEFGDEDDMYSDDSPSMTEGRLRYFKSARRNGGGYYRNKRQSADKTSEIIDKLSAKFEMEELKMEHEIGNQTCMLRECGVIDASNKLVDVELMIRDHREKFDIKDPWLQAELEKGCRHCHAFASSVPQDMLDECEYGEQFSYLVRVKFFKMCMKISKVKTCMYKDVKDKVESNFGPAEDIVKQIGLDSVKQMLPIMHKILYGDMMD